MYTYDTGRRAGLYRAAAAGAAGRAAGGSCSRIKVIAVVFPFVKNLLAREIMRIKLHTRCLDDGFYRRESQQPVFAAGPAAGQAQAQRTGPGRVPPPRPGPRVRAAGEGSPPRLPRRPLQGGAGGEGSGGRGAARRWGGSGPAEDAGAPGRAWRHGSHAEAGTLKLCSN